MSKVISRWAQAMLALSDLVIVAIDTTSTRPDADVLRVHIAGVDARTGEAYKLYDQVFQPQRSSNPNTEFTGISEEQLYYSPTLSECWDDIRSHLKGSVVLSYPFVFVQGHLEENEKHYGLEPLPIVGACLMRKAEAYFEQNSYMSLRAACARIGHEVPDPAMAHERAEAIAKLLHTMAEGLPRVPEQSIGIDTVLEDLLKEQF